MEHAKDFIMDKVFIGQNRPESLLIRHL